jgi:hypothetical protein
MNVSELNNNEYNPYYQVYINAMGNGDLNETLSKQCDNFPKFIKSIPEEKLYYAYGKDKWTTAEILLHIIDAERVFQYRALRFARMDRTPLPGFDQDLFVPNSNANNRSKESLIEEYIAVRKSTIALYSSFDKADLQKVGIASDSETSVAAVGFIICGHQRHHRDIIKERYLQD